MPPQHPGDLLHRLTRLREVSCANDRYGNLASAFLQLGDLLTERDAPRIGVTHGDEEFVDAVVWLMSFDFEVSLGSSVVVARMASASTRINSSSPSGTVAWKPE
jgi:hypothetical protein